MTGRLYRLAICVLAVVGLTVGVQAFAEDAAVSGQFEVRTLAGTDHRYVVYLPPGYTREKRWPVILFLHGAGERGRHPLAPTYAGLGPVLRHSPELYPGVVVFPQCETWDDRIYTSWAPGSENGERAMQVLAEVEQAESIDSTHRTLTGWSMGGFGVTAWTAHAPEKWTASLAISGGLEGASADTLAHRPLWLIHGDRDEIVRIERSRKLAAAFQVPDSRARFDEVTDAGHEVWERVYSNPRVAHWLIEGGPPPAIDWTIPSAPQSLPTAADGAPFIPAATVSQALAVRIGNDALQMLSAGIPESVKPERLQGTLDDVRETLNVDNQKYELALTGLTYAAHLESSELSCQSTGEILADLGVGLELRIEQASLTTTGFSAKTGAFRIVIGHRRPVPLRVRITPHIVGDKVQLSHRDTTFPIPDDNWYVEIPPDIQILGQAFTQHEIETGIVGGLYTRKAEVEKQVRSVIPPLLDKVEQRLNLDTSGPLTRWLWPFPVYQPRLRWTPESIGVDAHGLSIQLGAVVAANSPESKPSMRALHGTAALSDERQRSRDLHVIVDPTLIEAVSEEFAVSGVARINVLDLPEQRFQSLADPNRLRSALPQLPEHAELRSVLSMNGPFRYRGTSDGGHSQIQLSIPEAGLEVFTREPGQGIWSLAGRFPITVNQEVALDLAATGLGPPRLAVQWSRSPQITLAPSSGGTSSGTSDLEHQLREAWIAWATTRDRPAAPTEDFVLGQSRLRLRSITLAPRSLAVNLVPPAAEIRVSGPQPLRYRIRRLGETWSLPQTIEPAQSRTIPLVNTAEWQLIGQWGERNSLSPGEVIDWNSEEGVTVLSPASATTPSPSPPVSAR
jgi:predicted esterase